VNCDPLAYTGIEIALGVLLFSAIACVLAGAALLMAARRTNKGAQAVLLIALLVGASLMCIPGPLAQAATSDCVTSNNSLTVTQTSTMENLAPGVAPAAITGRVRNNSTEQTHITAVEVEITSVTTSAQADPGRCSASDYIVYSPYMPVGRTLGARESLPFSGASIGFRNKATNQNACKDATIHLLYTANPPS
jgi:hypothetical protein